MFAIDIRAICVGISAAILILLLFGAVFTVDQTERAVVLDLGAFSRVAQPGLSFKSPLLDTVVKISIQTQTFQWGEMTTYSADQQAADLRISITLHVDPVRVAEVYERFGDLENLVNRLIDPIVKQQSKIVFGRYTAVRAIQERAMLNADIGEAINAVLADETPVVIESVQIENIQFSKAYEQSVEQRMMAEVEVLKLRQNAEREKVQAQIVVTQAEAKASAIRVQAQAEAAAIRLRGQAEAEAIKARGAALRDNPNLPVLVQAERWDGKLPLTMLPGAVVPMLNLNGGR
ncbi:MAG: hypothetical protein L0Y43_10795 [Methylococcaceae bacterium]|nr:hypothetical protein [Methylococcaceae bacterium]